MRFDNETIAEEVKQVKGVYVPVKSSLLRCLLVRHTNCSNLHPNPDDEFAKSDIGPNYQIVSKYEKQFRDDLKRTGVYLDDPLIVERIYPSGYLILNGHHRWAAALRMGYKRIPIRIVNLPQEQDIEKMIRNSTHDVRVTLDLDEVVFSASDEDVLEQELGFPFNHMFKKRLRRGIPALFRFFEKNGYDIWVYSSELYSLTLVQLFFRKHHVHVDGIVTGTMRKNSNVEAQVRLRKLLSNKYTYTYHVDSASVIKTHSQSGDFEERELSGSNEEWSADVMEALKELNPNAED